jgi:hypothetical protein
VVLGGGAEEGDASDVDLFDGFCEGAAWAADCGGEGIEVADDDGDGIYGVGFKVLFVRRDRTSKDT